MTTRAREEDVHEELAPVSKRVRIEGDEVDLDNATPTPEDVVMTDATGNETPSEPAPRFILEDLLPPSRSLLSSGTLADRPKDQINFTLEADVGITEYIGKDVSPIHGIIKQRHAYFVNPLSILLTRPNADSRIF